MEKRVAFAKAHVLGNSYLVCREPAGYRLSSQGATALCTGRPGLEAHGVVVAPHGDPCSVRVFNADGSLAEVSGNGLRIYTWWLVSCGEVDPGERVELNTGHGTYPVLTRRALPSRVGVGLGRPHVDEIGAAWWSGLGGVVGAWRVRVGNPHCCILTSGTVAETALGKLARAVGESRLFSDGANVEILAPLSEMQLSVRVWERGVGETPSSGSGSAAAAAAAWTAGLVGDTIDVVMPGGVLRVEVDPAGVIWSWGSVEPQCEGHLDLP
jgi:diaminopimelate epimerase